MPCVAFLVMARHLDILQSRLSKETLMSVRRRAESKEIKKDQTIRREVLDDIAKETVQDHQEARYRNANRDQARGDWDRSRRHTDEGMSREEE
jgi:hypothetical protein